MRKIVFAPLFVFFCAFGQAQHFSTGIILAGEIESEREEEPKHWLFPPKTGGNIFLFSEFKKGKYGGLVYGSFLNKGTLGTVHTFVLPWAEIDVYGVYQHNFQTEMNTIGVGIEKKVPIFNKRNFEINFFMEADKVWGHNHKYPRISTGIWFSSFFVLKKEKADHH